MTSLDSAPGASVSIAAAPAGDSPAPEASASGMKLVDLFLVLARHRLLVIGLPLLSGLLAAAVVLIMPNVYTASAIVIPVQQSQGGTMSALLGQLSPLPLGDMFGNKNEALFVRILQSRTIAERVVKHFNLMAVYDRDNLYDTLVALQDHVSARPDAKSGLITISVDDEIPSRAADMANYFVDQLTDVIRSLNLTESSRRRIFYEKQFDLAQQKLRDAEAAFKAYQVHTGTVSLDSQGRTTLALIASLEAEVTNKEIQLQVARATVTDENPVALQLNEQIRGLRGKLARMKDTESASTDGSLGKLSAASTEYAQRWREVKYREAVVEALSKQYELSRLEELRENAMIQVLDHADTPQRHAKPRRFLVVLGATLLGGLLAMLAAILLEGIDGARKDPVQARKWLEARGRLLHPIFTRGSAARPAPPPSA